MKKNLYRIRKKFYLFLWSGITLVSIYLLIRFAALSFFDNSGQADLTMKDVVFSMICDGALETGSSLISYQIEGNAYAFPTSIVHDKLALGDYLKDNSLLVAKAQEYYALPDQEGSEETWVENGEDKKQENSDNNEGNNSILYSDVTQGCLSKEYILTNGSLFASGQLPIGYLDGEITYEETEDDENAKDEDTVEVVNPGNLVDYTMEQLKDVSFLIRHFYIVDQSTAISEELFDAEVLLGKDMTIKQENNKPQILIYHTHSQEAFIDSRKNKLEDTVVGVGTYLAKVLEEEYGYNVIHDTTCYDIVNEQLDRNVAYNVAEDGIVKIVKENPSIEVVIDLHRDSSEKRTTIIDGEETAQIMLFNGLSRDQNGPIDYLENPNLQDNLAFSLQLQLKSLDLYPGLFYRNYLKSYRYNMHVRKKSILMELGTYKNTLQSAKNAMLPFAEILDAVLQGE